MKKYILILILLLIVGCSKKNNEVECVQNYNSGYEYEEKVIATIKDDKVTSIKAKLTFQNQVDAFMHCESLKAYKEYENDKLSYSCGKTTIDIDNYEVLSELEQSIVGLTKQEYIDLFTSYKYACK